MTNFEKITESPDALAAFLRSLNVIDGPWDIAFHHAYCDDCSYLGCDKCPHEERNNPGWWLSLEAGSDQAAAEERNGKRMSFLSAAKRTARQ